MERRQICVSKKFIKKSFLFIVGLLTFLIIIRFINLNQKKSRASENNPEKECKLIEGYWNETIGKCFPPYDPDLNQDPTLSYTAGFCWFAKNKGLKKYPYAHFEKVFDDSCSLSQEIDIEPTENLIVPSVITNQSTRNLNEENTELSGDKIKISLAGDLSVGRDINAYARTNKDYVLFYSRIADFLSANDLNIANLESPIISDDRCPIMTWKETGTYYLCGGPQFLDSFANYNFHFGLANNHINNFNGLEETMNYLKSKRISFAYSHVKPVVITKKTIKGVKFGFLSYDLTDNNPDTNLDTIVDTVKKNASNYDWLIVQLHWGTEYANAPSNNLIPIPPYGKYTQKTFARKLIDSGADIIHGHHPHVLQPIEEYYSKGKKKLIFYSLGNFVFDQYPEDTRRSKVYRIVLDKNDLISYEEFPIEINPVNGRPQIIPK